MNILIIGSGAREHAIASALHRSPQQPTLCCYGSAINPGIKQMASYYHVGDMTNIDVIVNLAKEWKIGLAIIGPEDPLEKGLADKLWQALIPTVGPKKKLAQIETNKGFARDLMQKYNIPGLLRYRRFSDLTGIDDFLKELGENNYVVKANGLMGGKGVRVAGDHLHSFKDALMYCKEIFALGQPLVIEEKLIGQEFSLMCFCDGEKIVSMPIVQDHKRAFVDDKGPNTGGMGSYSDTDHSLPFLSKKDVQQAQNINQSVIQALSNELNDKYIGILYGSFIATRDGIYVIEFNARFGDPEALNVLTLLDSDFVAICQAMVTEDLSSNRVRFLHQATVCKYAVPKGYPETPVKNAAIDIAAVKNKAQLYLASVNAIDGKMIATGSRAAAYVGVADSISAAEEIAEREIRAVVGPLFHREDIGTDRLIQRRVDEMRRLRAT
ncbi:MAG TPA: phosphoribosylamine--glycine ligase [Gammaproteobacteria bacterium]|nr:phosphoribosylamine--glycine ligase [Gammaproteobacteria bacterium]